MNKDAKNADAQSGHSPDAGSEISREITAEAGSIPSGRIDVIGGIAPSGRWVFFRPTADFSKMDEGKLQRFAFETEPQTTRHSVAASGIVYEILERLGLTSLLAEGDLKTGAYNAALRLAIAILRCHRAATPTEVWQPPIVTQMMSLPPPVLSQYQFDLARADELTTDDLAFFQVAAEAKAEP